MTVDYFHNVAVNILFAVTLAAVSTAVFVLLVITCL